MSIYGLLQEVAGDAAATGAPVTVTPGQVPVLVAKTGPCVLVGAPTVQTVGLTGRAVLQVPLLAVMAPPGTERDLEAVLGLVDALRGVFGGPWEPVGIDIGDLSFRAYKTTVERKTHG